MPNQRLVRRKPFLERITSQLNPMDFLLWLSEEIETRDWESTLSGTQLGLGVNLVFLLARANSALSEPSDSDIFGDDVSSSWLSWLLFPVIWGLVALSCANAIYALSRTRKYRVFQSRTDLSLATPSAKRVKAQSAPAASSPLRYFAELLASESSESRAPSDKTQDTWELSVWDPLPMALRLLCLFSPGHVLVYLLFFPLAPLDPQPSVAVFNVIVVQALLTGQMLLLSSRFTQQAKDKHIVQREVMNEYDTKFVQPRINPMVRDVGTQVGSTTSSNEQLRKLHNFVQTGTPTTLVRPAFLSRPNPMPSREKVSSRASPAIAAAIPQVEAQAPLMPTPQEPESTFMPSINARAAITKPSAADDNASFPVSNAFVSASTNTGSTAYAGHMGIYSHVKSPLKKAAYTNDFAGPGVASPRNSREMAAYEQRIMARPVSPIKQPDLRRAPGMTSAGVTSVSAPFGKGPIRERQLPKW